MAIIKKDPWTDETLDKRKWRNLSSGGIGIVNMDKRILKGVKMRVYQDPEKSKDVSGKPYYSVWVEQASFKKHGHRWM